MLQVVRRASDPGLARLVFVDFVVVVADIVAVVVVDLLVVTGIFIFGCGQSMLV